MNVLDPGDAAPFASCRSAPTTPGAVSAPDRDRDRRRRARQSLDRHGRRRTQSRARRRHGAQSVPARSGRRVDRCRRTRSMRSRSMRDGRVWVGTDGGGLARVVGLGAPHRSRSASRFGRAPTGSRATRSTASCPMPRGGLWLSGNAGLMRFDPATRRRQDLSPRARPAGRGVLVRRVLSAARRPRRASAGPAASTSSIRRALSENRQPPRLALTNVEVLGVRCRGRHAVLAARPHRARLSRQHRLARFRRARFHARRSTTGSRIAWPASRDDWIDLGAQRRITLTNLDRRRSRARSARGELGLGVERDSRCSCTIHRDPAPWAVAAGPTRCTRSRCSRSSRIASARTGRSSAKMVAGARAPRIRSAAAHARAGGEQPPARRSGAAKSDFLDRMSHELRTPMNGVVGMTELLSRTALSATQSHLTKTIRSSAQILLQIVNDLLDLSKIRAGKVALEALPDRSRAGARGVHEPVRRRGRRQGHRADRLPAAARRARAARRSAARAADPDEPRRQRREVHRAGRSRRARGRRVRRAATAPIVQLAVTDTGIGMDASRHRQDLRAVRAGRRDDDAQVRRHGPGARDLPRAGRPHGRQHHGREPAADRLDVLPVAAADSSAPRSRATKPPARRGRVRIAHAPASLARVACAARVVARARRCCRTTRKRVDGDIVVVDASTQPDAR